MGNGGVGPFNAPNDPDSNPAQEALNIQTIAEYYEIVYNQEDLDAIDNYIDLQVKVHRDGKLLTGRQNLKNQIIGTLANHGNLTVSLRERVAAGARVSYRINVEYDPMGGGPRRRFRGIAHSRLSGGRILETWVHYEPSEILVV